MIKVALVLGTRPEAIKLAPVVLAMRAADDFAPLVCNTGQHREMVDSALATFGILADADLGLMHPDQTLGELTGRAVPAIDAWLAEVRPDLVLVQGDTTTVFCAALAAFYRRIPVGHVEAGLRTWDKASPFPEELNRVLTTRVADWHFAPTEGARQNLLREGVRDDVIFVTGNTVIDALLLARHRLREQPVQIEGLDAEWLDDPAQRLVLITGHRRENFGDGFEAICVAIRELAQTFPDLQFVYPVHLNPHVQTPVRRVLADLANVCLLPPQPYLAFVALMTRATVILTDSGGVQEEAPSLGKPVLVMRESTERPEAVAAGTVKLVGADTRAIVRETTTLLRDPAALDAMARCQNPYGDGHATERILAACRGFRLAPGQPRFAR
jgi:UDP-N-acetylglucosamine 2-epimerase (non-hydrolysing)